jgi:hypothetical protein
MTDIERSEIISQLHRAAADLGVIYARCQAVCGLSLGMRVAVAREAINEAISEFKPDQPEVPKPAKMDFGGRSR